MSDNEPNAAEVVGNTVYVKTVPGVRVGVVAIHNKPVEVGGVWIAIPGGIEVVRQICTLINGEEVAGPNE